MRGLGEVVAWKRWHLFIDTIPDRVPPRIRAARIGIFGPLPATFDGDGDFYSRDKLRFLEADEGPFRVEVSIDDPDRRVRAALGERLEDTPPDLAACERPDPDLLTPPSAARVGTMIVDPSSLESDEAARALRCVENTMSRGSL